MKILVTGADGYIGSVLTHYLIENDFVVKGLDTGFYTEGSLYDLSKDEYEVVNKDIRNIEVSDLEGFDAVVHMAELSNDPTSEMFPEITYHINHKASVNLAGKAKEAGVTRFVYTSSCSVYGIANTEYVDEDSQVNPQTAYADCKVLVERDVSKLSDKDFAPTFLRNATAFGTAPRMRFDLVVNSLCGWAWTNKLINMTSDGTPWRPLVHVLDISKAIKCVLESPVDMIYNQKFNVGDTSNNYQVKEIASLVAQRFSGCDLKLGSSDGDSRSYRVSFDKINETLEGFSCEWDLQKGIDQIYDVFSQINLTQEIFQHRPFTRLKQLKHLIDTKQIDENLFWLNSP